MLAQIEALVGRVDDDGILGEALLLEILQHAADVVVHGLHGREVVMHVALIAPADEVLTLRVGFLVGRIARLIISIPHGRLLGVELRRTHELHVLRSDGLLKRHVILANGLRAVREVVEERRRFRVDAILVEAEVLDIGLPLAVRRLVLTHEHERLGLVALGNPIEGKVGDDVGDVTLSLHHALRVLHRRVIIDALSWQHLPEVETDGVADEVPLADDGGLVAGLLKELREGDLRAVEDGIRVVIESVQVRILAGEDNRATRTADGVGHQGAIETHAFIGEAIDVRGLVQLARVAVGADGLIGMVIGEDEHDVRLLGRSGRQKAADQTEKECQESHGVMTINGGESVSVNR